MPLLLDCVLAQPWQLAQIVFSLSHHRSIPIRVLVAHAPIQTFFQDALINTHYKRIQFTTFNQYIQQSIVQNQMVVLFEVPSNFQTIQEVLSKAKQSRSQSVLLLLKINRKYVNMLSKKVDVKVNIMQVSAGKFVGINDKLRQLVEHNYDLNRAGFYAYGAYINNYRHNLLKKIFRTQDIDVGALARSFGYTTAPRIKEGSFLTDKARKVKMSQKRQKTLEKKKPVQEIAQKIQQGQTAVQETKVKKTKKIAKQVEVVKKNKKIIKKIQTVQTVSPIKKSLKKKATK